MRIASIMMGVVGGVVLVTCLLTVFFFPLDSALFLGKVTVGLLMVLSAVILNWEGVKNTLNKRSSTFITTSIIMTLGLGIGLGAVNYFAFTHKKEWDLTKDKVFTLSDQTQKVLQGLHDEVLITAFFRKDEAEGAALDDIVGRYRLINPRVTLQLVAPEQHPDLVEKYKVTESSPRIIVEARGQQERIKNEISEETLTNAIVAVAQKDKKKLYFTQGHGEPALDSAEAEGINTTVEDLQSEGYETATVNLVEAQAIPEDTGVLMIVRPSKPFFEPEVKLLEAFLSKGGKVLLAVEPGVVTGLETMLGNWRLELGNNMILDATQFGRLFGQGPDAAIVFQYGDHKSVADLEGTATVFKSARSVTTRDGDASITATVLASSNERSWGETKVTEGDWQWNDGELRGPVPLLAVATKETKDVEGKKSDNARLLVYGDADIFNNQFRVLASNRDLVLNTVAFMAEEENRISIRPKHRGASRIVLTPAQEMLIAFFALDGMPVALLSFGLGIWLVRRRR